MWRSGSFFLGVVALAVGCAGKDTSSARAPVEPGSTGGGSTALPGAGGSSGGAFSSAGGGSSAGGSSTGGSSPGGASSGGAATVSDGGSGVPLPSDAGSLPSRAKLRSTNPGDPPVFDPDGMYVVGYVSDVNQYDGPYGIAPVDDISDTVLALSLFGHEVVRRGDGHLLHDFLGSDPMGNGIGTPVYEFRRDEGDYANLTYGETVVADTTATCAAVPLGPSAAPNRAGRYFVSFDGAVFVSCYVDLGENQGSLEKWYRSDRTELPLDGLSPITAGPEGRLLAVSDHGTHVILDLKTGTRVAAHSTNELFGGDAGSTFLLHARALSEGFLLLGGPPNYEPTENLLWVALTRDGDIVSTGTFAPVPAGVSLQYDNWTGKYPMLDGLGRLYQFGVEGTDDGVIVRRPRLGQGDSEVVFRQSSWATTHPHQVMPEYLVTGP
ncbi:MAG TPA: hypothetical protein VHE30_02415 [Polyangiaceae bacterium]|nr:hypothetical protein [Polyangiaceae bacterium]